MTLIKEERRKRMYERGEERIREQETMRLI